MNWMWFSSWTWDVLPQNSLHLVILGVLLILGLFYLKNMYSRNLPPGPRGLPLVGYWPFLSSIDPHLQLDQMRKQYGDVFGMYLGRKYTVFISDIQTTKEAFNRDEFTARPEGAFEFSKAVPHFASMSGQKWKDQRRIAVQSIRRLGIGSEALQDLTRSQIAITIDLLEKEVSVSGGQVNFRSALERATTGVIFTTVCGKTFPPEHPVFKIIHSYLSFFAESGTPLSLITFMPWLKPILSRISTKAKATEKIFKDMEDCIWSEIESHERDPPEEPVDLIDNLLKERSKPGGEKRISRGEVNGNSQIMLFAGSDTVRGSVEWFLLCVAKFQDIQERIFKEIDDVLGPSGKVSYSDRTRMPYTDAAILESMRYTALIPLSPVHSSSTNTTLRGYDIPKDTMIFSNTYSIHHDPGNWKHPFKFYPEHFLTPDGLSVKVPEAFVPFSIGKRICVGDKIALVECFIFSVSLLQRFKILPPEGGVNLKGNFRVNMEPVFPAVKLFPRYM